MKLIKFKIAIKANNGDINPEIPGYLIKLHGISIVIHNWHPNYDGNGVHKDSCYWKASEYHTGRSIVSGEYMGTRNDVITAAEKYIANAIKEKGKKKVLDTINKCPQINS